MEGEEIGESIIGSVKIYRNLCCGMSFFYYFRT